MFTAGRPKISARYHAATSYYGSQMGTCYHSPAYAEAWSTDGRRVEVSAEQHPGLEPAQLVAKARAILVR